MKNNIKTLILVLVVGVLLGYLATNSDVFPNFNNVSTTKAKASAEAYLATLPLDSYEVKEVAKDGSVYRLELMVNGQPYTSYMSKDGKFLFQGGIDLTKTEESLATGATQQPSAELPKSAKPNIELFVMSHCPYGTQMEKGILPVIDALGNNVDFTVKFVDYAMHGKTEIDEELNQYCIQKDMGRDTYLSYLKCFLGEGKSEECLTSTGINKSALAICTAQADAEFKINENYNDKSTWKGQYPSFDTSKEDNIKYGVAGSPTLIINGVESGSGRDSASLLATVCSAFDNQPESCNITLESASPTTGFGFEIGRAHV